jgi:hypothetical protein
LAASGDTLDTMTETSSTPLTDVPEMVVVH